MRAAEAETPTRAVNAVVFATALLKHLVEFGDAGAFARACASPPAEGGLHAHHHGHAHVPGGVRGGDRPERLALGALLRASPRVRARAHRRLRHGAVRRRERERDGRRRARFRGIRTQASPRSRRRARGETRADWVSNRASANATDALIAALASRVAERAPLPKLGRLFAVGEARVSSADERGGYGFRGAARRTTPSLAARFASAFSFSFTTGSADRDDDDDAMRGTTPLADACARLFLVLVTFPA